MQNYQGFPDNLTLYYWLLPSCKNSNRNAKAFSFSTPNLLGFLSAAAVMWLYSTQCPWREDARAKNDASCRAEWSCTWSFASRFL